MEELEDEEEGGEEEDDKGGGVGGVEVLEGGGDGFGEVVVKVAGESILRGGGWRVRWVG